jgi:hypothetical protein
MRGVQGPLPQQVLKVGFASAQKAHEKAKAEA